jgi:hypothetical protein
VNESALVDPNKEPALNPERRETRGGDDEQEATEPAVLHLSEHPEVGRAWEAYLVRDWRPWKEQHARWQDVQDAYARLFATNQDLQRLGEDYELVVGFGYLTWRHASGYVVRRHLLVAQAALDFDAARGVFSVRASSDGARLSLEMDGLDPQDRLDVATQKVIESELEALAETPWVRSTVDITLRKIAHTFDDRGTYSDSLAPHEGTSGTPAISFAPALILRKRSSKTFIAAMSILTTLGPLLLRSIPPQGPCLA